MSTTRITSPVAASLQGDHTSFYGSTAVTFRDGIADVEDISPALKGYFIANGYGVGSKEAKEPAAAPEVPDPRDVTPTVVGTELRDAAVDPDPAVDFLAPTNAGDANPHGPDVVSPEIHASEGVRPVKAGDVTFNGDTDKQDAAEVAHTEAATDGTPVVLTDDEKDLLGLNTRDAGDPDEPVVPVDDDGNPIPADELKGQDLADALDAAGLPQDGTADEKRARLALDRTPVDELKGQDLADALALYELPSTGSADDKRAAVTAFRTDRDA